MVGDATGSDLFLLPMGKADGSPRNPIPYQSSSANEDHGAFSPDSRWMAFTSDESSEPNVYVQAVPASGPKWQISRGGGDYAFWRRDGRELYYVSSDRKLMAVPVEFGPAGFRAFTPKELFDLQVLQPAFTSGINGQVPYQPSANGRRFLMRLSPPGQPVGSPLEITLNWTSGVGTQNRP